MIAFAREYRQLRSRGRNNRFLKLLPRIQCYARFAFRSLKASEREEATAEVIASAFCAFHRLVQIGKANVAYAIPLARYAVAQYWVGRRAGASINSGDVLSPVTAHRKHVRVYSLNLKDPNDDGWAPALVDNTKSPVAEQAAFRIDFPRWLNRLDDRDRRLAQFLVIGNSTSEAANVFGLSRGRVSQLRNVLKANWKGFHGEVDYDANESSSKASSF